MFDRDEARRVLLEGGYRAEDIDSWGFDSNDDEESGSE